MWLRFWTNIMKMWFSLVWWSSNQALVWKLFSQSVLKVVVLVQTFVFLFVHLVLRRLRSCSLQLAGSQVLREGKLVCVVCADGAWAAQGALGCAEWCSAPLARARCPAQKGFVEPTGVMNSGVCSYGEVFQERNSFLLSPLSGMSNTLSLCMG